MKKMAYQSRNWRDSLCFGDAARSVSPDPAAGWPPVLGNLSAARAITRYATQVYPEYRAEGPGQVFNLVDGYYWLRVSGEGERAVWAVIWRTV